MAAADLGAGGRDRTRSIRQGTATPPSAQRVSLWRHGARIGGRPRVAATVRCPIGRGSVLRHPVADHGPVRGEPVPRRSDGGRCEGPVPLASMGPHGRHGRGLRHCRRIAVHAATWSPRRHRSAAARFVRWSSAGRRLGAAGGRSAAPHCVGRVGGGGRAEQDGRGRHRGRR